MKKQVTIKMPRRMLTLMGGALLAASSWAQTGVIKGQVKDASGEPVMGATITANGKAVGITDMDGNYAVDVAPGTQLTITYLGMSPKTVTASNGAVITLVDDSKALNEVVVIGYGRAKKGDLTGSVTAIKPDDLSKGITNNASDMLVGKVAGVDVQTAGGAPGAGAQIRIRGGASLSASNDPLYVIDGLVIDNNTASGMSNILAMVNPNDIESFTVLKDASATAIYGSRASNGVIIITTKKGRAGAKPQVSYNGDVTISTIQKKYDLLNASEYKQLVSDLGMDTSTLGDADTDWQDEIFRTAVSTSHNISVSGGLKNMPYRISGGFQRDEGIIKTSKMNRWNAAVQVNPQFFDSHLVFNINAKYMYEKDNYVNSGDVVGGAIAMDPTRPVYDSTHPEFGGYYQWTGSKPSGIDPNWGAYSNSNAPQNPVALLNLQDDVAQSRDASGNIEVDYKIHGFEDLHLHGSLGGKYTNTSERNTISPYSYSNNYYGWNGITRVYQYNVIGNAYAEYQHEFGVHDIDIMGGAEQSHYHRSGWNAGEGVDSYAQQNPVLDEKTGNYNWEHNPAKRADTQWNTHNSLVSYFGRLNYNLLDRYLITATFRADGSSRFRKGKKWGYFPSAAFAWKINQESFLKEVKWMDDFKLRLGWGKTGQQNGIDDFYYMLQYVTSNPYAQYPIGSTYYRTQRPSQYNPDLTWEKTTTYNAGIDFSVLNGRFTFNLDGYYRKTTDLLARVDALAMMSLGDQMLRNIGKMKNYGIEANFDTRPIVTKDFTWQLTYNVAWNHNEITELDAGAQDWVWNTNTSVSRGNNTRIQRYKVGEPVNSFYVYQQVYDKSGKPIEGLYVDRNGDGQINDDDRYYYKDPAPKVIMGLTTKFIYKNWDLSAAFHASIGNYVYYDFLASKAIISPTGIYSNSAFSNSTPDAVALGFTGTTVYSNFLSDYFVRNASYIKCTNITLGYSFSNLFSTRLGGRVYFTAQNPFIITKYDGLDPEISSGMDQNPYPRPMSFQLGLNLNF